MRVVYRKITSLKEYKEQLKALQHTNMHISQRLAIIEIAIRNGLQFLALRK